MDQAALSIFRLNNLYGYAAFCSILDTQRWATVPQALFDTYGVLVNEGLIPDQVDFMAKFKAARDYGGVPGTEKKSGIDQDLRNASISILRSIFELGPVQMNVSYILDLAACTR
jgi:hypothetical protein